MTLGTMDVNRVIWSAIAGMRKENNMSSSIFNVSSSSSDYSSLFSSLSTSSSSSSDSTSSLYTDWAALKNGSYAKLAKAYYSKQDSDTVDSDEAKLTIKANTELKSDATDVKSSISSLQSSSLYEKKTTTDEDGNTTTDYDYDKIISALKSFAESYNSVIDAADDSDNTGILRNAAAMTTATAANQNLLSSIGIEIGEDNKLTVNEDTVREANISDIKSLFQGGGSYGSQIESSSSELINKINAENNKLSGYTSSGTYSSTTATGSLYDGTY